MTAVAYTKPAHFPNEDSFLVVEKLGLFGVFDGVGGAAGGFAASEIAATVICKIVSQQIYKKKRSDKNILKLAFGQAAKNIELDGQIYGRLGQCTAVTVAKISKNLATIANVGDCRCYGLTKSDKLKRLTVDHGILEELIISKRLTLDQALKIDQAKSLAELSNEEFVVFGKRNIITRAVGTNFDKNDIDFNSVDVKRFKALILTTDGVHDNLTDDEIESIVKKGKSVKVTAKNLVDVAYKISTKNLLRSKPDDITAVVVKF